jgi:hypothetical protein
MIMKTFQRPFEHDLIGKKVAQQLNHSLQDVPYDIKERLKVARLQAVQTKKLAGVVRTQTLWSRLGRDAVLQWGGHDNEGFHLWAIALFLVLLVVGMLGVASMQEDHYTQEVAAIDTVLLTDSVPPTAYTDPGFVMFLRMHAED